MSWDKKRRKGHSSDIFDPPPPLKKSQFQVGGGGAMVASKTNNHRGIRLFDKIMILQGVKPTIPPLGVGYANRRKKAQNGGGGDVVYSHVYGPAWISSNNLGEVVCIFELPRLENCISRLCPSPLGNTPPAPQRHPKAVKKHTKKGVKFYCPRQVHFARDLSRAPNPPQG